MPTYEYVCRACGHEFEKFQKMTEDPITTCPVCGEEKVERLISSGGGIVFKGPGFYATDYRKGGPSAGDKESSGDAGSKGKESSGGGESSGASGGSSGAGGAGSGESPGSGGGDA